MPAGDRTGPAGFGPRTGRGAGFCSGFSRPGYANFGFLRGFRNRTYRRGFFGIRSLRGRRRLPMRRRFW